MTKIILKDYTLLNNQEQNMLLDLRNESYVRQNSLDDSIIPLENHLRWVESLKSSEDKHYFAVFSQDELVGAINVFDIKSQMKWGVFFKEEASLMFKTLVPIYFLEHVLRTYDVDYLYLQALKTNENAISFDKNLGFIVCDEDETVITMKMNEIMFEEAKKAPFLKRIIKKMKNYEFIMETK